MNNESYPLDETTINMVAELREQQKNAQIALNAILTYFARTHKLDGAWDLAQNGRELVPQHATKFEPPHAPQPSDAAKPNGADAMSAKRTDEIDKEVPHERREERPVQSRNRG